MKKITIEIDIKHSIGDKVYFWRGSNISTGVITNVTISTKTRSSNDFITESEIIYQIGNYRIMDQPQDNIFTSIEDALNSKRKDIQHIN